MLITRTWRVAVVMVLIVAVLPLVPAGAAPTVTESRPDSATAFANDVRVLPDGSRGLTVELHLPRYTVETVERGGGVYQQIKVAASEWTQSGDPGWPQLPERGLLLAVPPTGQVTVALLESEPQELPGNFRLLPAPEPQAPSDLEAADAAVQLRWQADPLAYAQQRWLPTDQAEITEEGWLRGMRFVRLALRPFQYNPAAGALRVTPRLRVRLIFSPDTTLDVTGPPADPVFDQVLAAAFPNYHQASSWRRRPDPQPMPALAAQHQAGEWVKVTVDADGVYRFTYEDLAASGVPTSTLDGLDPRTLRLFDEGQEQAIYVEGEADGSFDAGDYILFYGQRDTAYLSDDNNVYWLTWGGADGLRMATQDGTPGKAARAETLLTTLHLEKNRQYVVQRPWANWLTPVDHDHWFWRELQIGQPWSYNIQGSQVAVDVTSSLSATLSVAMIGNQRYGTYRLAVQVNGHDVGQATWLNQELIRADFDLAPGVLVDGQNTIRLTAEDMMGITGFSIWLEWLRLTYPYSGEYLPDTIFSNPDPGTWQYQLTGVPAGELWILNLADPTRPQRVVSVTVTSKAATATVTWQLATTKDDRFLVTPDSAVRQPAAIEPYTPSNLLDANQQVDYLVISHSDFITAVQPLVDAHVANGLSVKVVDVQDIYDEFSDGSLRAEAIRDYLAYAYSNYQWPPPTYVLLVGDGTIDFRGYRLGARGVYARNFIPPYVGAYDPLGGGTGISDSAFGFLQGNDVLPEVLIGRLPVNNVAETQLVVNKILGYMAAPRDPWTLRTLWVADNPDAGGNFHRATDDTIAYLAPGFEVNRIYYCDPVQNDPCPTDPWIYTDIPATRQAITSSISAGQLLINWSGHGAAGAWAHEWLFISPWTDQLTNGNKLGFTVISACATAYFARYEGYGFEERLIRHPNGGIVGGFAPTTFDLLISQTTLIQEFYDALMRLRLTQVGVAAAVARVRAYSILPMPYGGYTAVGHMIMGDPALQLLQPESNCVTADLDCDGDVDVVDILLVVSAWNSTPWDVHYNPRADLDHNRQIDINDLILAANRWRQPVSQVASPNP